MVRFTTAAVIALATTGALVGASVRGKRQVSLSGRLVDVVLKIRLSLLLLTPSTLFHTDPFCIVVGYFNWYG